MNFFDEAALRLKQQLKVTENKQVAEALGMTGNAWTMRKRRDAFPEMELRALAQQRPELGIDVEYVLTGGRLSTQQRRGYERRLEELQALPGSNDEKSALVDFMGEIAAQTATDNKRASIYRAIIDELRACSDETVALALTLVVKLSKAEQTEAMEADAQRHNEQALKDLERTMRTGKKQRNGPPSI